MAKHYKVKYKDNTVVVHCDGEIQPGDMSLCGADLIGDGHLGWDQAEKTKALITCDHCIRIIKFAKSISPKEIK